MENNDQKWFVVDAEDAILGRLSTKVAKLLQGKHKSNYTPYLDMGDYVIIINAEKVRLSGLKEETKLYRRHSGRPGGMKVRTARQVRETFPERLLEHSVKGMLPKGPRGRQLYKKLKVYSGPSHPHEAQQPETLQLN